MSEENRHVKSYRVPWPSCRPVSKVQVEASSSTQHVEAGSITHHQVEASLAGHEKRVRAPQRLFVQAHSFWDFDQCRRILSRREKRGI